MARSKSGGMSSPLTLRTIFIWVALFLLVASFFIFFNSPVSTTFLSITASKAVHPPERSFLRSLEVFLSKYKRSDFGKTSSLEFVQDLDDIKLLHRNAGSPLKVYVYDMPTKFTYDLLQLFWDTYHETSNLTSNGSPVHRLIEQHSIDFWLYADLLAPEHERLIRTMQRVLNQNEADIFYIPFFTTISYFLLEKQQCKQLYQEALNWVTNQQAWKRSGGHDHLLPVHHPWSFKSRRRFMKSAIWLLPDLDSTGNWYKPGEVSLEKDVVLPYAPNVDICDLSCLTHSWSRRKTLLFFRGRIKRNAGGKIRNRLAAILEGEAGVIIEEGTIGDAGKKAAQHGMRSSIFCLSPAGDTPSSARLFDAIVSGCIPVVVSDELEPPFEGILDYRKFALFLSSFQALEKGWLVSYLRGMSSNRISEMQTHITRISKHFQYSSPAQVLGPEDLTWQMIAGKMVSINLHIRRKQRMVEGARNFCSCDCRATNSTQSQF